MTVFERVKSLGTGKALSLPFLATPKQSIERNLLQNFKIVPEYVDGLVKFVCKSGTDRASFTPFGGVGRRLLSKNSESGQAEVSGGGAREEVVRQKEEIRVMKERIQKLVNMNKKLIEQLNNK